MEALLAGADRADELAEVEDELFRFGQVVYGHVTLAGALSDSTAAVARRAELVRALLEGKARPVTLRLAVVALGGFGGRSFQAALSRMVEMSAERRDRQVARRPHRSAATENRSSSPANCTPCPERATRSNPPANLAEQEGQLFADLLGDRQEALLRRAAPSASSARCPARDSRSAEHVRQPHGIVFRKAQRVQCVRSYSRTPTRNA